MTVSERVQRGTYLESSALAEFPHVLFFVVPNETSRARHTDPSQYTVLTLETGAHLRAKCVDFPQEVFHLNRLPARSIGTALEKIAVDDGVPAEPAPGNFPESLVVVVSRRSLDDGATRPKRR